MKEYVFKKVQFDEIFVHKSLNYNLEFTIDDLLIITT